MLEDIRRIVESGTLPDARDAISNVLCEADGTYTSQEGECWDFKREWPFSYSDEYFGGIARLICAFANTSGGLIVFGVHDESRAAGHNRVVPNMDKMAAALKQLLSAEVQLSLRRYDGGTACAIDVLLVLPIRELDLPVRFVKDLHRYKKGMIWVRSGHEVIEAEPKHVPLLYCGSHANFRSQEFTELGGFLPPSPSTVKRFVGRIETIDKIFSWLKKSDEPRTFLYGKGGSGKTTIAYEVARASRLETSAFSIYGGEVLDNIIFVSGK